MRRIHFTKKIPKKGATFDLESHKRIVFEFTTHSVTYFIFLLFIYKKKYLGNTTYFRKISTPFR